MISLLCVQCSDQTTHPWDRASYTEQFRMKIVDRRTAVLSSLLSLNPSNHPISISDTVQLIIKNCPEAFRRAVQDSDRFLYRGETLLHDAPTLLHPEPDLIVPGTYGDDPDAVKFFQCLEQHLPATGVRPSVGHIATASKSTAARWGTPVSVWPICYQISYLWPCQDDESLIYPPNDCRMARLLVDDGFVNDDHTSHHN